MAANPRKFSEKIALMKAKEAEANAAFDQILTEVSGITKTPDTHIPPYSGIKPLIPHGAPYAPFKTGSLPNINHSLQQQQLQQQQHHQHSPNQQMSPHSAAGPQFSPAIDLKSAIHDLNSLNGGDNNRRRFMPPQYGGGGGAVRPQRSRTQDHSSYSPYLTPHPLNGPEWKKFKSDSDIHGSVKHHPNSAGNTSANASGLVSPMIHRRVLEVGGNGNPMPPSIVPPPGKFPEGMPMQPNGMMPFPMGVGMPAPHPMSMTHPSNQNHHGSLPDLSNLGFNNHSPNNNHHGPCSPPSDGYGRMVSTSMPPPDSPSSMRPNGNRQHSPLVGSPTHIKPMQGMPHQFQYFPMPTSPMHIVGMPHHRIPNSTNSPMSHSIPSQQQHQNNGGQQQPPQQQSAAKQQATLDKQHINETIRRRISDKMLAQQQAQQFRQNSESVPSPASPGSEAVRSPDSVASHGDSMNFALSPGSHSALNNQFNDQVKMENTGISNAFTNGNISESPFIHDHRPPTKQHSIPNIIFTGADDNLGPYNFERELRQAMNVPMSESFDGNEMFSQDEQFKTDLTPLDLEGLQMLEDPSNVLTDPATEDQLRLC